MPQTPAPDSPVPEALTPSVPVPDAAPLIVTVLFDADTFAWLDGLRRAHFPPERNVVPGHVTLFHALPGDREADVRAALDALARNETPFDVAFPALRPLGRGVALAVDSPPLVRLRAALAGLFADVLTRQDAQGYRPHATVQNKVAPDEARATLAHLQDTLALPRTARAEGLCLWRYRGGPWEAAGTFRFGEAS